MQIRVQCGCGESSCPEWAVVELQGVVQPQASFAGDIRGLHIGRLCSAPSPANASSKAGFTFTVGYHELARIKVTLKKPLLVLRKKKNGGRGEQEPPEVELEVMGIIRHKILFKDRPKALISKPPIKEEDRADSSKLTPLNLGNGHVRDWAYGLSAGLGCEMGFCQDEAKGIKGCEAHGEQSSKNRNLNLL